MGPIIQKPSIIERSALVRTVGGSQAIRALPLVARLRYGIRIAREINKEMAAVKCEKMLKEAEAKQLQEENERQESYLRWRVEFERHNHFTRIIKGKNGKPVVHTFGCSHDYPLF